MGATHGPSRHAQREPDTSDGAQKSYTVPVVDLAPQVRKMNIDDIVERGCSRDVSPYRVSEHGPGDHASLVTHEAMEHVELAWRQQNFDARSVRYAALNIEREIANLAWDWFLRLRPPEERTNACGEFREREGFDQIVISAAIQASHTIFDLITRREDQHGRLVRPFSNSCEQVNATQPGQHPVENEGIEAGVCEHCRRFVAGGGELSLVALSSQTLGDCRCGLGVVFDDENGRHGADYLASTRRLNP
jgi:hypothetical protein